ncbi:hypothetical protein MTP99_008268 [Tenebrio molitor]|nr:hypothetical protein MTP99_008268 [Tenebrio molitor]
MYITLKRCLVINGIEKHSSIGNDSSLHSSVSRQNQIRRTDEELLRISDPNSDSSGSDTSPRAAGRKVSVPRPDDETFKDFYKSIESKLTTEHVEVSAEDFDLITRQSLF